MDGQTTPQDPSAGTPESGVPPTHDWRLEVDGERIGWLTFDREGESANALGRRPLEELMALLEHLRSLHRAGGLAGVVLMSGKPRSFIVGADIREFDALDTEQRVMDAIKPVNAMLESIEAFPVPVVAAIHGACVGGGLELVLACRYRIATRDDATRLGFPEVKLGLFPGFNGTARAIRQAGAVAAMQSMLTGSLARASAARAMGYVDELVASPGHLRWAARKAILQKRSSKPAAGSKALAAKWPARSFIAARMRKETAKKVREEHYPAPFRLIELFEQWGGSISGLKRHETRAFAPLMVSETSRNLRRVYQLSEMLKAQAPKEAGFRPLRAHVVGAGVMGADIAGWCVAAGMEVTLQDLSADAVKRGIEAQRKLLSRRFKTRPERDAAALRLIADPSGEGAARADIVIEAVIEKLEIKQQVLAGLEGRIKAGAVLATNTSSIMIEEIARALADPGRLVGVHFFNPVAQMPLVEVVRGQASRQSEIDKAAAFVTAIDKFPLVVRSVPGFLVNRVLAPYMFAAMQRLEQGEPKEKIDEAARVFGMPMGPIELADTVGLDVCLSVGRILKGEGPQGSRLERLVADKKLGKKSGEGFYLWVDGKPQRGKPSYDRRALEKLGRELVEPLILECERCRAEGVVASADLIDAGVIFGTGFAPFRGGPLHFRAREQGIRAAQPTAPQPVA